MKTKLIGGIFETYSDYMNHWMWQEKKNIELEKTPYCHDCGRMDWLQLHHITYENVTNESGKELMILCKWCHEKRHKNDKRDKGKIY